MRKVRFSHILFLKQKKYAKKLLRSTRYLLRMPEDFKTYPIVILRQAQDKLHCQPEALEGLCIFPSPQRVNAQF
jgi:hypothetical protein